MISCAEGGRRGFEFLNEVGFGRLKLRFGFLREIEGGFEILVGLARLDFGLLAKRRLLLRGFGGAGGLGLNAGELIAELFKFFGEAGAGLGWFGRGNEDGGFELRIAERTVEP